MTPKPINPFQTIRKRKQNEHISSEATNTIEHFYYYPRIRYSFDPNLLRQGDDKGSSQPPQEFTQAQSANKVFTLPSQATTEEPD
jgi:hypothetical protein